MTTQRLSARRLLDLLGEWRGAGHGYVELGDSIRLLVRDGAIPAGTVLPAERPLSDALGVSRTTVSAAYQRLRDSGTAVSRQGSGTVVRALRPDAPYATPEGAAAIDFSQACPDPWAGVEELAAIAQSRHPELFRSRGFDLLGGVGLRTAIAERYAMRGLPTTPDQIMVTLGAQHAIFLIARTLLRRGDRSLIESPSYPHAREALVANGALVAELPVGVDGYDAASILDIARRVAPRLAYLIPDHHNPTGMSMPEELRPRLIDELSAQGAYVVVDETTAELALGGARPVLPFAAAADRAFQQDTILTVGSLGKTVWGGLRVGWIRATPDLIARLEASRRVGDLGTGEWQQAIAALALERYDEILDERSRELTARHRVLSEQIAARLPDWSLSRADGGVCVWADLGARSSTALCRQSAMLGVRLVPGPRFGSPGVFERFVRLPFTEHEDRLIEAVRLLEAAWSIEPRPASGRLGEDAVI